MLRFLTTIKVITTKQRNKFKNNNREGGDKRGEKAPFPSGAHKQQEPVSLWQHLQTFLLLSQKYLMLMLQCDASAAVLSQRTFDLASSWLPERKNSLLTDCVWHLSWQEYSERRKEKRSERWEGKRKMEEWQRVIDVWNCTCERKKKVIRYSAFFFCNFLFFFFFTIRRTEGGFLLLSRCVERAQGRVLNDSQKTESFTLASAIQPGALVGEFFLCVFIEVCTERAQKLWQGAPEGACLHLQIIRWRDEAPSVLSIIPLNTPSRTLTRKPCPPHPKK